MGITIRIIGHFDSLPKGLVLCADFAFQGRYHKLEQKGNKLDAIKFPELVIGLAGAIGTAMEEIGDCLTSALGAVGYKAVSIRITDEIALEHTPEQMPVSPNLAEMMNYKMSHANALCNKHGSAETLAIFALRAIKKYRDENDKATKETIKSERLGVKLKYNDKTEEVIPKTAYIIRQLKRPEEIYLLRRVYGKQFILMSAYGPIEDRRKILSSLLRRSMPLNTSDREINLQVDHLIFRDENEDSVDSGQNLRETYPLADVFVDGISKSAMMIMISRFIQAFFGRADIAPTKGEYGMYAAKSASLRSTDLSRQIGAAIFTSDGEIITQGCNEVPKAFGGTYWHGEEPDYRDVMIGSDSNDILRREVVRDLLERLDKGELLSDRARGIGTPAQLVEALVKKPTEPDPPKGYGALVGSAVMDLTEYARVVHAEMCAICDAARIGRSIKGATLYCTTFPCHNCTKHILAAGLKRVIFIEPYPKSKAKELHDNEIEIEKTSRLESVFYHSSGFLRSDIGIFFRKANARMMA